MQLAERRDTTRTTPLPRVVIVGVGFGGLEAARALARAPVAITLVDRHNHHLFQPLLYQVATAALSPGDIAWPVRAIFRRQRNVTVLMAEVTGIDPAARVVHIEGGPALPYDYLVLAAGAGHAYFGHDEWEPFAPGLKTIEDATRLRRRLLLAFERAEAAPDAAERKGLLTFVVVGGGPTGVEMAGAIAELARHTLTGDFRRIDPGSARVLLIEAGPRLLPAFPEDLSRYAHRSLETMGVEVRTGTPVTDCDAQGVMCGGERIRASTVVWAAGVVASPVGGWLGAERDRAGRVKAGPDLSVPGYPGVFVVGDLAATVDAKGHPVPGLAPAAKQMGRYVGRLIAARAMGRPAPPAFAYRDYGDLATIGRKSAVVVLGRIHLTGFVGWVFWSLVHVWYLVGFRSRAVVAFEWLWSYLTFQRGARLIVGERAPAEAEARTPNAPAEQEALRRRA